ncbi:methionyl-tRNA formyltransferase [Oleomonas cavernae]|uniref:Methionyl-tRNA formyltransferase n=1 Tax=Oleomonas cavernae TaxID=2320859 RepID=A0A418WJ23_9PROT|nr:methionyl-tRNA formyltransferase [Oleomonas cavernae]RJF90033.1 methionyl-tRNA formyltransferase [Oleomonas cavernae]
MRLAFMGTPDFAVPTLNALIAAGHEVAAVYSQPPRPAGRGQKLTPSPVHLVAEAAGIAVRAPKSLRDPAEQAAFADLELDAAVVVAYGLILPAAVLWAPRLGCFNLHASILPRWRGAAPIQRAIWSGDDETGVAVMAMSEGLDEGPIVLEQRIDITPTDTAGSLHDKLGALGAPLMVDALALIAAGRARPRPQDVEGVTYARKIAKEDARIDFSVSADAIDCQVRALLPAPGAYAQILGERCKILCVVPLHDEVHKATPGMVLDERLTIACGRGAVRLVKIQRPGKAPMTAADLLRGFRVPVGTVLG